MGSRTEFSWQIFGSMLHDFLPFSPVSLTELYSFCNGLKDLFTLHMLVDKNLKLKTSQGVEGMWIHTGSSGANGLRKLSWYFALNHHQQWQIQGRGPGPPYF